MKRGPDLNRTRSENDLKEYRYITLPNGLECLLVSARRVDRQRRQRRQRPESIRPQSLVKPFSSASPLHQQLDQHPLCETESAKQRLRPMSVSSVSSLKNRRSRRIVEMKDSVLIRTASENGVNLRVEEDERVLKSEEGVRSSCCKDDGEKRRRRRRSSNRTAGNRIAAVSISVGVGSFNEPDNCQGLAHFLEHMLFMGSEKYPQENAFDSLLSRTGGSTNAYTDTERTVYYFSCFQQNVYEALDIFAQFFISPLLKKDAVDRELKSIESEFSLRLNVDDCRLYELWRYSARKSTPFAKFCCGNEQTLKTDPALQGVDIYRELRLFHEKYYIAPNMRLVLVGYDSLDEMERVVVQLFRGVSDGSEAGRQSIIAPTISSFGAPWRLGDMRIAKRLAKAGVWEKLLEPDLREEGSCEFPLGQDGLALGCMFMVPPVSDVHKINLSWQLPPQKSNFRYYACEYVLDLLGHESAGSVLAELKKRGWATALNVSCSAMVGGFEDNSSSSLFIVEVILTLEGLQEWYRVVGVIFNYIGMLRRVGPQEWFFLENKQVEKFKYSFKEEEDYMDYAVDLSVKMLPQWEVPKDWLLDSFSHVIWEPHVIEDVLNHLRPELLRLDVRSSVLWPASLKVIRGPLSIPSLLKSSRMDREPYTETTFWVRRVEKDVIDFWNEQYGEREAGSSRFSFREPLSLALPERNPYIPSNFDVLAASTSSTTRNSKRDQGLGGRHVVVEQAKLQSHTPFSFSNHQLVLHSFFGKKHLFDDYLRENHKLGKPFWADAHIVEHLPDQNKILIGYGHGLFKWHTIAKESQDTVLKLANNDSATGAYFRVEGDTRVRLVHERHKVALPLSRKNEKKYKTGSKITRILRSLKFTPSARSNSPGAGSSSSSSTSSPRTSSSSIADVDWRLSNSSETSCAVNEDQLLAQRHEEIWESFPSCTSFDPLEFTIPALASGSDEHVMLWFMPDKVNLVPRTECFVRFLTPLPTVLAEFSALNDFLATLWFESVRNESYLALLAELDLEIDSDEEGITVHISGFSEKLPTFLDHVIGALVVLAKSSKRFSPTSSSTGNSGGRTDTANDKKSKTAKSERKREQRLSRYLLGMDDKAFYAQLESLIQGYSNDATHFQTEGELSSALYDILVKGSWPPDELEDASRLIGHRTDVADFAALLLRKCKVEALVCGNIESDQAEQVLAILKDNLAKGRSSPLPEPLLPRLDTLQVPFAKPNRDKSDPWHAVSGLVHLLQALEFDGHSVDLYFQLGQDTVHNRLLAETIEHLMSEPLYNELRTKQQVGYMVHCSTNSVLGMLGFVIEVTSNSHAPHSLARIVDAFLSDFGKVLKSLEPAKFHESVCALARTKIDSGTSLKQEAESLWETIKLQRYRSPPSLQWKSGLDEIEQLHSWISLRKVVAAFERWLDPKSESRRRVSVLVFGSSFAQDPVKELTQRKKFVTLADSSFMSSNKHLPSKDPSQCLIS